EVRAWCRFPRKTGKHTCDSNFSTSKIFCTLYKTIACARINKFFVHLHKSLYQTYTLNESDISYFALFFQNFAAKIIFPLQNNGFVFTITIGLKHNVCVK
ncbi:MAG: hypothetical protein RR937_09360, partial [Ruthenibacterium sp.]